MKIEMHFYLPGNSRPNASGAIVSASQMLYEDNIDQGFIIKLAINEILSALLNFKSPGMKKHCGGNLKKKHEKNKSRFC